MKLRPPHWLPWLGPLLAALAGGLAAVWLEAGFWVVLIAALAGGLLPHLAHAVWRRLHHRG